MHSEPGEMILLDKYLLFWNTKTNLICINRLDIDFAQKNIWIWLPLNNRWINKRTTNTY